MATDDAPNPSSAMLLFFILTTIYSVMQYNASKQYAGTDKDSTGKMYFMIYLLAVVVGQFFINLQLTTAMCGSPNWATAAMCTSFHGDSSLVSYYLFSMFLVGLHHFNTFGYGVALAAGLNDTMVDILKPQSKKERRSGEKLNPQAEEALEHIYADRSLLVNEITSDNFDNFGQYAGCSGVV